MDQKRVTEDTKADVKQWLREFRDAYTLAYDRLLQRVVSFYDVFITQVLKDIKSGEWTDDGRNWPSRALHEPQSILDGACEDHLNSLSGEVLRLQDDAATRARREQELLEYGMHLRSVFDTAVRNARRRLSRRRDLAAAVAAAAAAAPAAAAAADSSLGEACDAPDSSGADAVNAHEASADADEEESLVRTPSPCPSGGNDADEDSSNEESDVENDEQMQAESHSPAAAFVRGSDVAVSPDFADDDGGMAHDEEADAAHDGGPPLDESFDADEVSSVAPADEEADAAQDGGPPLDESFDADEVSSVAPADGEADAGQEGASRKRQRVQQDLPSRSTSRSRSPSCSSSVLAAAQTAYDAADAKYNACPTHTTREMRTWALRRQALCSTAAFATAQSFLTLANNPGTTFEQVWIRVKENVPVRFARLALYHAARELDAKNPQRARGFLIEAIFRHLLYGDQDLSTEWRFVEAKGADEAWRAGGRQSQVADLLQGTGGFSELLAGAAPDAVLEYLCVQTSGRLGDIFAGDVSAAWTWEECAVSAHAEVFGHSVTDPARRYDIAFSVSQGQHITAAVSLLANTPLTWYGVTAGHGRQNTPPSAATNQLNRGDWTHKHIVWGSGGVWFDGRYCKPTDALAGGGAFANNPPAGIAPSLKSSVYAVRLRGTPRIVPVLVMLTTAQVEQGDELTYAYSACFDAEPTLLAMRSCAELGLYRSLMPHLDPAALFGSYAGCWQHLRIYEERRLQRSEAKSARNTAREHLDTLLSARA